MPDGFAYCECCDEGQGERVRVTRENRTQTFILCSTCQVDEFAWNGYQVEPVEDFHDRMANARDERAISESREP